MSMRIEIKLVSNFSRYSLDVIYMNMRIEIFTKPLIC
nr:MAG TPA: hypothetical protein [Caudoviricetes sp.]